MDIELVYFEGCPNTDLAAQHLEAATAGRTDITITRRLVTTPDDAERLQLHGSPTILIDGHDPFASKDTTATWSCRLYQTDTGPAGAPSIDMLESAIDTACSPR